MGGSEHVNWSQGRQRVHSRLPPTLLLVDEAREGDCTLVLLGNQAGWGAARLLEVEAREPGAAAGSLTFHRERVVEIAICLKWVISYL